MYGIVVKQAVLYCCISLRTMSDSPFYKKKVSLKKEESFLSGALSSTFKSLDDAFISAIPSDDVKALPSAYLYPVGTLIFIFLVAIFVAVFVPGEHLSAAI